MCDLIANLEKLEGPCPEMDALIAARFHAKLIRGTWPAWCVDPPFTASLDAAIALFERVLPGWRGDVDIGCPVSRGDAIGVRLFPPGPGWENFEGEGATPSIALIIALLRAKEAGG